MHRALVDPTNPSRSVIAAAAAVIRAGGVVALPTDTLYGLAADPSSPQAVRKVFEAKGRPDAKPLPLVAVDVAQVEAFGGPLPETGRVLALCFWPGPLTLLLIAPAGLAAAVTGDTGRVGIRVPSHAVPRALCAAVGSVLTATSANQSGRPAAEGADEVAAALANRIDMLIDGGRTTGGLPSTIVDVSGPAPRLVRAGAVSWERIEACLRRG